MYCLRWYPPWVKIPSILPLLQLVGIYDNAVGWLVGWRRHAYLLKLPVDSLLTQVGSLLTVVVHWQFSRAREIAYRGRMLDTQFPIDM